MAEAYGRYLGEFSEQPEDCLGPVVTTGEVVLDEAGGGGPSEYSVGETVTEWVPEEKMAIAIDQIKKIPVKQAKMTFTLAGDETTVFGMSYEYEPSGGPFAFILGPILDRQMNKGFNGFIDYLEPAAQAKANG